MATLYLLEDLLSLKAGECEWFTSLLGAACLLGGGGRLRPGTGGRGPDLVGGGGGPVHIGGTEGIMHRNTYIT